jgi:hypothetical protein
MQLAARAVSLARFRPVAYFGQEGDSDDDPRLDSQRGKRPESGEELHYVVEVWDDKGGMVEQTLAITANGSIGYAAYYEATREFPGRYVTLRHKNRIVARWNTPKH